MPMSERERLEIEMFGHLPEPDIDICTSCGRAYGYSDALKQKWIDNYHPREGDVMPQHCFKCM